MALLECYRVGQLPEALRGACGPCVFLLANAEEEPEAEAGQIIASSNRATLAF